MSSVAFDDPRDDFGTFLRVKKGLSEKTVRHHKKAIESFLEFAGTYEPSDSDVMRFRKNLIDSSVSNSHINNVQKAIEYYFEYQGREDELGEYKRLPRKNTEPNPYTDEEVQSLLNAASTLRDRAIILFLVSSGVRNSAATKLSVKDIDLEKRTAHIGEAKQHNEYTAIFSERAAEAIHRLVVAENLSTEDPVFPSRTGDHLTRSGLLQIIRRIGDRAGIENPTVHRFRATFANRLRENGADIYRIKELMGHTDIRSSLKYLQMDEAALRDQHDQYIDDTKLGDHNFGEGGETDE